MMDNALDVAKAMIQAGIQAAAAIAEQADMEVEVGQEGTTHVLH